MPKNIRLSFRNKVQRRQQTEYITNFKPFEKRKQTHETKGLNGKISSVFKLNEDDIRIPRRKRMVSSDRLKRPIKDQETNITSSPKGHSNSICY